SSDVCSYDWHPGAVYGKHIGVHPVLCRIGAVAGLRLRDFVGMMRSGQIHSSAVDIEACTQVFVAHGGTFDMPSGETDTPGRRPAHDVLGVGLNLKWQIEQTALISRN